eukprot:6269770-Prorocentrum_lima.AAC.1
MRARHAGVCALGAASVHAAAHPGHPAVYPYFASTTCLLPVTHRCLCFWWRWKVFWWNDRVRTDLD